MRSAEFYRWRVMYLGKLRATRYLATEEEIRKQHPEAQRIDESLEARMLPETPEEQRHSSTSAWLKPIVDPSGETLKLWEQPTNKKDPAPPKK